jgi:hypothetical protein
VAFRPTITRGLALSAMLFLNFSLIKLCAFSMPTKFYSLNLLISIELFQIPVFMKKYKVPFFVIGR